MVRERRVAGVGSELMLLKVVSPAERNVAGLRSAAANTSPPWVFDLSRRAAADAWAEVGRFGLLMEC